MPTGTDELAAFVAHEIANAVQLAELALARLQRRYPEDESLAKARRALGGAAMLLRFADGRTGTVDMDTLRELLTPYAEHHGVTLIVEGTSPSLALPGAVVVNLALNAIHAAAGHSRSTPPDEDSRDHPDPHALAPNPHKAVRIYAHMDDHGLLTLSVDDTGPGLAALPLIPSPVGPLMHETAGNPGPQTSPPGPLSLKGEGEPNHGKSGGDWIVPSPFRERVVPKEPGEVWAGSSFVHAQIGLGITPNSPSGTLAPAPSGILPPPWAGKGLPLVRLLVEREGGILTLESSPTLGGLRATVRRPPTAMVVNAGPS